MDAKLRIITALIAQEADQDFPSFDDFDGLLVISSSVVEYPNPADATAKYAEVKEALGE